MNESMLKSVQSLHEFSHSRDPVQVQPSGSWGRIGDMVEIGMYVEGIMALLCCFGLFKHRHAPGCTCPSCHPEIPVLHLASCRCPECRWSLRYRR